MAQSTIFECDSCDNLVVAWDDGDPYYIDWNRSLQGEPRSRCKVYAHHPEIPAQPIEGVDAPHLCLDCTHQFRVDSERPRATCTKCRSGSISDTCRLEGRTCPKCRIGSFEGRPGAIS